MALKDRLPLGDDDNIIKTEFCVGVSKIRLVVDISEILVAAGGDDESAYTELELEHQLEKSSYYRKFLFDAYLKQRRYRLVLKRELDVWYATVAVIVEKRIIKTKTEAKFSMSAIAPLISSGKLEEGVLRDPELSPEYQRLQSELEEAVEEESCLKEFSEIVKDRSIILMAILRRNRQEQEFSKNSF